MPFVLNISSYIPNLHTIIFFTVLIAITVILCTNGSINNFVGLSVCLSEIVIVYVCVRACSATDIFLSDDMPTQFYL